MPDLEHRVETEPSEPLDGGYITAPLRIGDTVRRQLGSQPHPEFVRELLRFFQTSGWTGAPRYLGIDQHGREILSYIHGHAAWQPEQPDGVWSDDSLRQVAQLVREFHDLTTGTPLAGNDEVVCHNDLSPRNTIYRDTGHSLSPVAFIDWDLAQPGARIHDIALMCWQYISLGPGRAHDLDIAIRQTRLMTDAYGLDDRSQLIETVLWWQDRCWKGIEQKAAAGDPSVAQLVRVDAARHVREAYEMVAAHRTELERRLR